MGKHQGLPGRQTGSNVPLVDGRLRRIGDKDHDDIGPLCGVTDGSHGQSGGLRLRRGFAGRRKADQHLHAAVFQVERVGMSLRAVADDGYLLRAKSVPGQPRLRDTVSMGLFPSNQTLLRYTDCERSSSVTACAGASSDDSAAEGLFPRRIATIPVRTISRTP
jgi:hypothetical protein